MKKLGTVYLVGAGPGDAGLLTLRGAELLRRADVVIYDALVNLSFLKLAPTKAEILFGGRRAKDTKDNRPDVIEQLIAKAREGKTVVRLKGGDPYVFGRGGEEAEQLHDAKIPFEVVPGVSAFAAVPNYAGIPLTHRDHCSQLTILPGHDDPAAFANRPGIVARRSFPSRQGVTGEVDVHKASLEARGRAGEGVQMRAAARAPQVVRQRTFTSLSPMSATPQSPANSRMPVT